jgi:hypothetical protein
LQVAAQFRQPWRLAAGENAVTHMAKPSTRPGRARPARRAAALIGVVLSLAALNSVSTWAQAPVTRPQAAATAPVVPAIPIDGKLTYRGITVDATEIKDAPQYKAIMTSFVHQIDIVADCGAKPEQLQFFRSQTVFVKHAPSGGLGHFDSRHPGVTVADVVAEAQKPILLHELLHAYHFRVMADGYRNAEILTFFGRAQGSEAYPKDAYVLKNVQEFFAVTASLYLWGNVDRPPHTRDKLKAAQPVYYAWLGQQFGVVK